MSELRETGPDNQELFTQLSRIADEIDPVPPLSYELGYAAFDFRRIDSELVELAADSAVDNRPLATVRGESSARLLTFEAADLEVDMQVVPHGGRRSLLGQVVGAVTQVQVESVEGVTKAAIGPHGRFQVDDAPAGRIRLHVTVGSTAFVTSWVSI
ncbi:MAG: hypothetical protein ACRDRV_00740 [Pseudonocardiaceae bacterium]